MYLVEDDLINHGTRNIAFLIYLKLIWTTPQPILNFSTESHDRADDFKIQNEKAKRKDT